MNQPDDHDPFFVGYLPLPRGLRPFVWMAIAALLIGSAVLGYAIASTQDDPGQGRFRFDLGPQTVTGVIELTPSPILHVTAGTETVPAGRSLMLSGQGKNGAVAAARTLEGQLVTATGIVLQRGDLDMLQLNRGESLRIAEGEKPDLPLAEPLGRWQLSGEICDGKCLAGAMRPGRGIAHRACANLCIIGGIPPVFVLTQPVEQANFLMIAGVGDEVLPPVLFDYVGLYLTLEGDIVRHGDLLVLTVDAETVELVE